MNRKDEYLDILSRLEDTPIKLDYTYERAQARYREYKIRRAKRAFLAPLTALLAVFALFAVLVNLSPAFAFTAGRIPFIGELAKFVAYSPSLSAAVENEHVQPMELSKTQDGIKAKIEYVIVDQKQLNIFYTLESESYALLTAYANIASGGGSELSGFTIISGHPPREGGLQKITIDFFDSPMPASLSLTLRVLDISSFYDEPLSGDFSALEEYSFEDSFFKDESHEPDIITEISFTLSFDPMFTAAGKTIEINRQFTLDGQKLTLVNAEIYPTHMRFSLDGEDENTAWLTGLDFYVENEKGERFDAVSNGLSSSGSPDSPMTAAYMLESAFFSKSESLTLCITGAQWLDKDKERLRIDLSSQSAECLPQGVSLISAKKHENGWLLEFTAEAFKENRSHQVWSWDYYDAEGNKGSINGLSSTSIGSSYSPSENGKSGDNSFGLMFALKDYPYDEVWLCPSVTRSLTLDVPLRLEIS